MLKNCGLYWIVMLVFLLCDHESVTNTQQNSGEDAEIEFVDHDFEYEIYEPDSIRPFAEINNDTLYIADYWCLSGEPIWWNLTVDFNQDSIIIEYLEEGGNVKDWMPPIENIFTFYSESWPESLVIKFKPFTKHVRAPRDYEIEMGYRNASEEYIKTVYIDSII